MISGDVRVSRREAGEDERSHPLPSLRNTDHGEEDEHGNDMHREIGKTLSDGFSIPERSKLNMLRKMQTRIPRTRGLQRRSLLEPVISHLLT
jgi:hypothetical protein